KPLHGAAGQRPTPETSAGAQKRRARLSMYRPTAATRTAERQLRPAACATRVARPDPAPGETGGGENAHGQPPAQSSGSRQYQAGFGSDGHSGGLGPGHAGSPDGGPGRSREARRLRAAAVARQDPGVGKGSGRTPDRAPSFHAPAAVERTRPARGTDRRVGPQDRGAHAPS